MPIRQIRREIEDLQKNMEQGQRQLAALLKKIERLEGESDTELRRRSGKHVSGAKRGKD